ncbi:MAG: hypothetical protein GY869_19340, partial [Planctomycetes bacterium]|nr:hypothetical protein [Planctomycetota bacterium]
MFDSANMLAYADKLSDGEELRFYQTSLDGSPNDMPVNFFTNIDNVFGGRYLDAASLVNIKLDFPEGYGDKFGVHTLTVDSVGKTCDLYGIELGVSSSAGNLVTPKQWAVVFGSEVEVPFNKNEAYKPDWARELDYECDMYDIRPEHATFFRTDNKPTSCNNTTSSWNDTEPTNGGRVLKYIDSTDGKTKFAVNWMPQQAEHHGNCDIEPDEDHLE